MKKKNTLGIVSMILSIVGLLLSCLLVGVVPAFFGLILGIIALTQKDAKKGTAITGTVCSAIAILIFIFVMAAGQGGSNSGETEDKEKYEETSDVSVVGEDGSESEGDKKEDKVDYIEITSTELIAVYDENQVKCAKEYDGKKLKVTGTVTSIGTDIMDNIYVCLGSDEEYTFVGIQCYAKDKDTEDKIAELKEGDIVTVIGKGECGSFTFDINGAEIIE